MKKVNKQKHRQNWSNKVLLSTFTGMVALTVITYKPEPEIPREIRYVNGIGGGNLLQPTNPTVTVRTEDIPLTDSVYTNARVSQRFLSSANAQWYQERHHMGTDIVIGKGWGENVLSLTDGKVIYAKNDCASTNSKSCGWGYGNLIIVDSGPLQVKYGHGYGVTVKIGDTIKQGDVISKHGNSGFSTATHSHIECRGWGLPVDCFKLNQPEIYKAAGVKACERFLGDKRHRDSKELIREHCGSFLEISAKYNQDFFEILGVGQAETNFCTHPNANIPDKNCYGWSVHTNDRFCGSWEKCFEEVNQTFQAYEQSNRWFLLQKIQRYSPPNENDTGKHTANIYTAKAQLVKYYKEELKI